jgi:hypothetical protein
LLIPLLYNNKCIYIYICVCAFSLFCTDFSQGKSGAFGAVGCLPGVKNPICVAYDLMLEERKGLLNFGLIPPMSIAESLI